MAWGWVDGWGRAAAGTGGVIGHGFGAILDFATGDSNGYDANGNLAPSEFDKMLGDLGKTFGGVGAGLGPAGDGVAWLLHKDYELYSDWVSRPIATVFTQQNLRNSPEWQRRHGVNPDTNPWDAIRSNTMGWGEAWSRNTDKKTRTSPGRGLMYLATATDLEDPHAMEDAARHWWFKMLSGTADAATLWYLDPLALGFRGAAPLLRSTKDLPSTLTEMGASREVSSSTKATREVVPRNVIPGEVFGSDAVRGMTEPNTPLARTLDWAQRKADKARNPLEAARVIERHPMLRNNPNGGLLASMLADSTRSDKDLIMRIAMGDGRTFEDLRGIRADLTARLSSHYDVRPDLIRVEGVDENLGRVLTSTEKALNQNRITTLDQEIDALEKRVSWIDDLIGPAGGKDPGVLGAVGVQPKGGAYVSLATKSAELRGGIGYYSQRAIGESFHYYNPFNSPVRVIGAGFGKVNHFMNDQRPQGHLDINDPEGWKELDNTLSRAKGFSPDRRREITTKYMRATSEGEKIRIAEDAEREAITHIAHRFGMEYDEVSGVISDFMGQRNQLRAMLKNRAFTGATDPASGRRLDFVDHENIPNVIHPMLATQLAERFPLADMDTIQRAFGRNKNQLKAWAGMKARDPLIDASDILSSWWKTASLMRFGYMVRVLADDEMAYLAKLGAMTAFESGVKGSRNWALNRGAQARMLGRRAAYRAGNMAGFAAGKVEPIASRIPGTSAQAIAAMGKGAPAQGWARELPDDLATYEKRRLGHDSDELLLEDGTRVKVQGWAPATKEGEYWRGLTSDDRIHMDQAEGSRLHAMRLEMGHGLVNKGDANYHESWSKALNQQLGQDEMARLLLQGKSPDDVVKWLKSDPKGRAYARRLPFRAADPERWVHNVDEFINQYATTPELRGLAVSGKVNAKELKRLPDEFQPTQVHGGLLAYNMGQGAAAKTMQDFRESFYRHFNGIPTDVLVRHPLARALYDRRRNELINRFNNTGGILSNQVLRSLENQSRAHTLHEVNKVVLDLTHHSNAAHVFRFVAPFYNAWDKALRRWGRLAYGDPGLLFKGNLLWQGSNNLPIMLDKAGDVENLEGEVLYGKDKREFTGLKNSGEQLLTFRLPERMAKKIGASILNQVQIPKSSMNLVLQGNQWYLPGFGPFVQVPVSMLTKNMPQHAEMLKTILPFGPQSISDLVLPTSVRKLAQWQDDDGDAYASMRVNIWRSRYAQWIEGGRQGAEPDIHDPRIEKDAKRLFALRFFTQMIAPVNVRFTSPYKFYIDQYHKMMQPPRYEGDTSQVGPDKAHEAFLMKYPDYFMFAESISKNNARIPPTLEAWKATKRYKDVLAQVPDIAPVVLGQASLGGDFNSAVYRGQFQQRLSPSTDKTARQSQSLEEFAKGALSAEGWRFYRKYADLLRVEMNNRGLQSYQQKGAEDLQQVKEAVVNKLKETNPAWHAEYSSYDATRQANIIEQMQKVISFEPLQSRSDIQTLGAYLSRRDQVMRELNTRDRAGGSGDIKAVQNRDLYQFWQYERDRLAQSNTVFSENIYDRFLVHDDALRS